MVEYLAYIAKRKFVITLSIQNHKLESNRDLRIARMNNCIFEFTCIRRLSWRLSFLRWQCWRPLDEKACYQDANNGCYGGADHSGYGEVVTPIASKSHGRSNG